MSFLTWRISAESAVLPVPQGVQPDGLGDSGAAGDPPGAVPVQVVAVGGEEHRSLAAFADREVDGAGGARGQAGG
jgi:hypothetical protein